MEYTISIKEPKINQKIAKLLELHRNFIAEEMGKVPSFEIKHVISALLNSDDFEKLLDANIALFEVLE